MKKKIAKKKAIYQKPRLTKHGSLNTSIASFSYTY